MLNICLPLSGKKKTIQSIQFGPRFVAREASQVGNARSLGYAETKRGPVNTKSGLVMDRRATDSDGLLRVRASVAPRLLTLHLHTLPPPPTATHTVLLYLGVLCYLLQQFHRVISLLTLHLCRVFLRQPNFRLRMLPFKRKVNYPCFLLDTLLSIGFHFLSLFYFICVQSEVILLNAKKWFWQTDQDKVILIEISKFERFRYLSVERSLSKPTYTIFKYWYKQKIYNWYNMNNRLESVKKWVENSELLQWLVFLSTIPKIVLIN